MKNSSIETRANFGFIRYGAVWEDADILCQALRPVAGGKRILSIASAGDNALALLTLNPKEIVAVDLNQAQLACLDLRMAAFRVFSYEGMLSFIGVTENPRRLDGYHTLRRHLGPWSLGFWDNNPGLIQKGILHSGKLERFLRFYQWCLRSFVHPPHKTAELLKPKSKSERLEFYSGTWNTLPWRILNRVLFSRRILGMLGRDPEFFKHAEDDVSSVPERRLEEALSLRPAHANPYLAYHLTGNYSPAALPVFLRRQNFKVIRSRVDRVKLFHGKAEDAPGKFSGFNLSNIFEYMDLPHFEQAYLALLGKALPKARLAYWNLHVERSCPGSAKKRVRPLPLAAKLHKVDSSWVYRSFHLEQTP